MGQSSLWGKVELGMGEQTGDRDGGGESVCALLPIVQYVCRQGHIITRFATALGGFACEPALQCLAVLRGALV